MVEKITRNIIGRGDLAEKSPLSARGARSLSGVTRQILPKSYLVLVLLIIIVIGYIASPYFLTMRNAGDVVTLSAITSVLAVGQFFVILTGGIDLSVGSTVALATVIASLLLKHGQSAGVAAIVTLLICAAIGLVNGIMIVWLRIPPFIATLASLSMVQGLSYIIQSTTLIQISNNSFINFFSAGNVAGVPNPVVILIVVTLIAAFVNRYTTFGRRLNAIGGNVQAARLSGLPVGRDLMFTYTVSGLLAGLAGLLAAAQLLEGSSLIGQGYELNAIAAVVVGGASLAGGKGDPISAVIGGFIIEIIVNIMNVVGISSNPQLVIQGAVIVVAVFFSSAGGISRVSAGISKLIGRNRGFTPAGADAAPPGHAQ
jgi:ribose transport system permease protein